MKIKSKIVPKGFIKIGSTGDRTQADTVKKWNFTTKLKETYQAVENSDF